MFARMRSVTPLVDEKKARESRADHQSESSSVVQISANSRAAYSICARYCLND